MKNRSRRFQAEKTLHNGSYTATASIVGDAIDTTGMWGPGEVDLNVSALTSGTTHSLDAWLQGSIDGGVNWFDIACEKSCVKGAGQADVTCNTTTRNLNGGSALTAPFMVKALIHTLPPRVRFRGELTLTGATPSCVIAAKLRSADILR